MTVSFPLWASVAVVLVVAGSVGGCATGRRDATDVSTDPPCRCSAGATDSVVWPKTAATDVVKRSRKCFRAPPARGRDRHVTVPTTAVSYVVENLRHGLVDSETDGEPKYQVLNRFLVIPKNRCLDHQTLSSTGQCVDKFEDFE